MSATVSWSLDENTELLAKILAVIIFINEGVLHKNSVTLKKTQQATFSVFALILCHTIFLSS